MEELTNLMGAVNQELKVKKFYFPNKCNFCHHFPDNLKRCGVCEMVSYCCKAHQESDWETHKQFCKVIKKIKKEWKVDNVFQSLKSTAGKKVISTYGNIKINDDSGFQLLRPLAFRIKQLLKREWYRHELEMIFAPRVCAVCFESNPQLLINCKKCPQASFCKDHLNDRSHHQECSKLSTVFWTEINPFDTINAIEEIANDIKEMNDTDFSTLPTSMDTFFETYLSHYKTFINGLDERTRLLFNAYFSDKFTRPLTVLFAMDKLGIKSQKMIIHVVGATNDEKNTNDWDIMFHYLPELCELQLIFIGPELSPHYEVLKKACNTCQKKKKSLKMETQSLLYENYCRGSFFKKPDMIVGFNLGLYTSSSWDKAIEMFSKGQCPVLVTAFNQTELTMDKKVIKSKFPSANWVYCDRNPFASFFYTRQCILIPVDVKNDSVILYKHLGTKET